MTPFHRRNSQILSCGDTNFLFVEFSAVPDVSGKRCYLNSFSDESSNVCSLTNPYFYKIHIERRSQTETLGPHSGFHGYQEAVPVSVQEMDTLYTPQQYTDLVYSCEHCLPNHRRCLWCCLSRQHSEQGNLVPSKCCEITDNLVVCLFQAHWANQELWDTFLAKHYGNILC